MPKLSKKPATKPSSKAAPSRSAASKAFALDRENPKPGQKTAHHSKQSNVIAMLQSPAGATIAAMMKKTGWKQHTVRGFLAGVIRKKLNLKLDSNVVDDNRVYRIEGSGPKTSAGQSKHRA